MFINVNKSRLSAQPLIYCIYSYIKQNYSAQVKLTAHFNAASEVISGK